MVTYSPVKCRNNNLWGLEVIKIFPVLKMNKLDIKFESSRAEINILQLSNLKHAYNKRLN